MKRKPIISARLSLVAGVEAAMDRVLRLSQRALKVAPSTGAHCTLLVAWHKLDQAARLLRATRSIHTTRWRASRTTKGNRVWQRHRAS